jgi:hypothetical protein
MLSRIFCLTLVVLVIVASCSEDEPNQAPTAINITEIVHDNPNQVVIHLIRPVDPEGGSLTYTLFLNDSLISSVVDWGFDYFIIGNLLHSTFYFGKIVVTDEAGGSSFVEFNFTTMTPDPVFNGDLVLTSQREADIFPYTHITGTLTIAGAEIKSISKLSSLISIVHGLYIRSTSLRDLRGLENVEIIESFPTVNSPLPWFGREIEIKNNENLQSIIPFNNLDR